MAAGDVTAASWNELVKGRSGWGLSTDHIAEVFFALRLIQRTGGDVLVLENLDAAAIAASVVGEEKEKRAAVAFVLLWALVANDGEIFLNLLLAGFDERSIRAKILAMLEHKRTVLGRAIPGRDAAARIARVVTIERQERNKGSAGIGKSVQGLRRTEPLQSRTRNAHAKSEEGRLDLSADYFRKVPPRRKDWARTLGLWSDPEGLTTRGQGFLRRLRARGYIGKRDFFTFWPMEHELVRSGFKPDLLGGTRTLWATVADLAWCYAGVGVKEFGSSDCHDMVEQLRGMMGVYQSLHCRKAMLRRELSVTAAYPAVWAVAVARGKPAIDFPRAVASEQVAAQRRVTLRRSRNTGGALALKR